MRPGIHAKREDTHTLRLTRELADLRVGYVNRILLHLRFAELFQIGDLPYQKQKTDHEGRFLFLRRVDKKDATLKIVKSLVL